MKQNLFPMLLCVSMLMTFSACGSLPSATDKTASSTDFEEQNIISLDNHIGDWTLPNNTNDSGDYHICISKEDNIYRLLFDMSSLHKELSGEAVLSVNEQEQTATSVESFGYDAFNDSEEVTLDIDIKWNKETLWIKGSLETLDGKVFNSETHYQKCNKGWTAELPATYYEQSPTESITQNSVYEYETEKQTIIEDWKIKSLAEDYFRNVLKNELTKEARQNGITMAITVSGTQIISRSEHTANVRARLNYTAKEDGVRNTGNFYAVAMIDVYTGEILSADIQ